MSITLNMSITLKSRRTALWIVASLFLLLPVAGHGRRPSRKATYQTVTLPKVAASDMRGLLSVALITVVKPPVFWSADAGHVSPGSWRNLVKMKQPKALHAGEVVRCGPGGVAELLLSSGTVTMTSRQVLPIVNVPPANRASLDAALDAFLATAGNPRGMAPVFLSPIQSDLVSESSVVWPETFTFEWRPLAADTTLVLTVRQRRGGPTLWQEAGISGKTGGFVSVSARDALTTWRNTHNSGDLFLDVLPSSGPPFTIRFSVLSAPRERSLAQVLSVSASTPSPLLRHLSRDAAFYRAALYPESAAEYHAARKLAPNSPLLRRRTAEAYKMYRASAPADVLEPQR